MFCEGQSLIPSETRWSLRSIYVIRMLWRRSRVLFVGTVFLFLPFNSFCSRPTATLHRNRSRWDEFVVRNDGALYLTNCSSESCGKTLEYFNGLGRTAEMELWWNPQRNRLSTTSIMEWWTVNGFPVDQSDVPYFLDLQSDSFHFDALPRLGITWLIQ